MVRYTNLGSTFKIADRIRHLKILKNSMRRNSRIKPSIQDGYQEFRKIQYISGLVYIFIFISNYRFFSAANSYSAFQNNP